MSVIIRPRPSRQATSQSPRGLAALITGGAVVLALVLATVIPARADTKDDLAKAVIAALLVGVIANELDDDPKPRPTSKKRVPAACAISIDGADRSVTLFPESCLIEHGLRHLPRDCGNRATIFGQRDRVFSARCLLSAGFRLPDL